MWGSMTGKRIAVSMMLMLGVSAAAMVLPLLKERSAIPPPPPDEIPHFVLTREFALQHDATVLRVALGDRCRMDAGLLIAASAPKDRMDGRQKLGLLELPEDWGCPSVRRERPTSFREHVDQCLSRMMRDGQHTPLPCLQRWYPGLEAWISLDMPRYLLDSQGLSATVDFGIHCGPRCGSGWRSRLRLRNGVWHLVGTEATWIL